MFRRFVALTHSDHAASAPQAASAAGGQGQTHFRTRAGERSRRRLPGAGWRVAGARRRPRVAVGTALAGGPPRRSQRAELPHWAPGSGQTAHGPTPRRDVINAPAPPAPLRRTRSGTWDTPDLTRLCVRGVSCRPGSPRLAAFPPPPPQPSPCSAASSVLRGDPTSHARTSQACGHGLPWAARPRSTGRASVGSPGSRASRLPACKGSLTARGPPTTRDNAVSDVAFRSFGQRRHPETLISRLNDSACTYPCPTLRRRPHGRRRRTRGHRGSLLLRCRTLSFLSRCRFIPALPNAATAGLPPSTQTPNTASMIDPTERARYCRRDCEWVDYSSDRFGCPSHGRARFPSAGTRHLGEPCPCVIRVLR